MNNEKLIEIIREKAPMNRRTLLVKCDEDGIITFRITQAGTINVHLMLNSEESVTTLDIFDFNSEKEVIHFSYNMVTFNIVVDKENTTRNDIKILNCTVVEDEEGLYNLFVDKILYIKKMSESLLKLFLLMLEQLIYQNSKGLTMSNLGYKSYFN